MLQNKQPIGIFDSGLGGLSVAREIRAVLPHENIIYFADSAHCPYGARDNNFIQERIISICDFLAQQKVKLIVVACNTASSAGLEMLRLRYQLPIVGMEPAVKPAAEVTQNGRVGVMATGATLNGQRFMSLLVKFSHGTNYYTQPCQGLVEMVEEGHIQGPGVKDVLLQSLRPLLEREVDTIVLGCTHYPFLKKDIEYLCGPNIKVIDTGQAVARQVLRVLQGHGLLNDSPYPGKEIIYTSGSAQKVQGIVQVLLPEREIPVQSADI